MYHDLHVERWKIMWQLLLAPWETLIKFPVIGTHSQQRIIAKSASYSSRASREKGQWRVARQKSRFSGDILYYNYEPLRD